MRAFDRLAILLLLAIHLAAASVPCPTPKLPDHEPGALAGAPAHPCPAHAGAENNPAQWFDSLCPCGCETGAPPGGSARTGPALLLAKIAALCAPDRAEPLAPPLQLARLALAPPDHVPLAIA
jgi:hypothetical protein